MLSAAKHLSAHRERPFVALRVTIEGRVVCSRVVSRRGKFESEWSPVARVARVARVVGVAGIAGELARFAAGSLARVVRVVRVVGVVGIAVLFSGNGVPVNG